MWKTCIRHVLRTHFVRRLLGCEIWKGILQKKTLTTLRALAALAISLETSSFKSILITTQSTTKTELRLAENRTWIKIIGRTTKEHLAWSKKPATPARSSDGNPASSSSCKLMAFQERWLLQDVGANFVKPILVIFWKCLRLLKKCRLAWLGICEETQNQSGWPVLVWSMRNMILMQ